MPFDFSQFITEYFVNPITHTDTYAPYNVVNTTVFAIIAIAAIYLIFKFLNSRGIKTDEKFYWAIIPYIFLGSIVRVLSDAKVFPRGVEISGITFYPFITPQIYVVVFAVTIAALLLSRKFFLDNWQDVFFKTGAVLAFVSFLPLIFLFKNFVLFGGIIAIAGILFLLLHFSPLKTSAMEKGIILSQGFDGAATFVGVQFGGYSEQHVVGNLIFDVFGGPWAFLVVKLLFAVAVVYVLRKESEKAAANANEEVAFVSLVITIFGLAPGLRDALRLLAGV
ncbi:MAG: DUF63 family protein [Candidatus Micrarchaeota archaeon]|nr:DUF63 family protein [Candidatus Micrarchaeota archaeon]